MSHSNEKSYRQIFKSTALVAGAQVITMLVALARGKAIAVWLGKEGVGLVGLYGTALGFVAVFTGLGLGSSGVRQIAESSGTGDEEKLARTVRTLRIVALATSITGMILVIIFCRPLSQVTFGSVEYAAGFALLGMTLLCHGVSAGQIALLQGLRRLKEMAAAQISGAIFGSVIGVLAVYYLRERGVAWFLIAIAGSGALASWLFARRIKVARVKMTFQDLSVEARGLLTMGIAFMTANLVTNGVAYLTRVLIKQDLGLGSVGLYSATWNLSSQYVGLILGAMAVDFTPRLTAAAKDNIQVNRLVNEQMELGVLLALPGVLATLTFAPWVLHLFYSSEFVDAAGLVRWQMLGIFLRVVSWPLGLILIAKGMSRVFTIVEIVMGLLNIGLLYGCMKLWGLEGVGIAFSLLYVISYFVNWMICRRMSGYATSSRGRKIISVASVIVVAGFLMTHFARPAWSLGGGVALTLVASVGCYIGLIYEVWM